MDIPFSLPKNKLEDSPHAKRFSPVDGFHSPAATICAGVSVSTIDAQLSRAIGVICHAKVAWMHEKIAGAGRPPKPRAVVGMDRGWPPWEQMGIYEEFERAERRSPDHPTNTGFRQGHGVDV